MSDRAQDTSNVTALAPASNVALTAEEGRVLEQIVIKNDLSALEPADRVTYYRAMCRMVGVNPLNRPFEFLDLDGGLQLYASRRCADELRHNHRITISIVGRELMLDGQVLRVTARATFPDGRTDEADGVVPLVREEIAVDDQGNQIWKTGNNGKRYPQKTGRYVPMAPNDYANAVMKAETKAKRRVTLSAVGLGLIDESEIETIRGAHPVDVDLTTGEIQRSPATASSRRPSQPPRSQQAGKPDGKAIHFRGRISELTEPLGWTESDLNAAAESDLDTPYMDLNGDGLELLFRDLEGLHRDGSLADYLKQLRARPDAEAIDVDVVEIEGHPA